MKTTQWTMYSTVLQPLTYEQMLQHNIMATTQHNGTQERQQCILPRDTLGLVPKTDSSVQVPCLVTKVSWYQSVHEADR